MGLLRFCGVFSSDFCLVDPVVPGTRDRHSHCGIALTLNQLIFFSRRRRHTSWPRDWSSDVCSSDLQIVENLIQRRVDAILLAPSGSREVIPVISKANQAGIPVIILDTRVDEELLRRDQAEVAAFIGSDNYEGGVIAATYVGEVLNGSGKVAILEGIPGHETADSRQRGFLDGISKFEG